MLKHEEIEMKSPQKAGTRTAANHRLLLDFTLSFVGEEDPQNSGARKQRLCGLREKFGGFFGVSVLVGA